VTDYAIAVAGMGKRYEIAHQRDPYGRLTESLWAAMRAPIERLRGRQRETTESFWALRDVSFEVRHGEVLGVIGRNGAGKSTLLKILSRITEPTTGKAMLEGRVGSLLEVGTGFHPELTGRENIFMSGAVLGMRRGEIERKFDEIVDFAGVAQFLDTPVKRYSSGMQVRLGFAVAAHLEPEILLIDEVLAVGDAEFQRRCLARMGEVSKEGRTILFVSHNLAAVEALCGAGILLEGGALVATGTSDHVIKEYLKSTASAERNELTDRPDRQGSGQLRVTAVTARIRTGSPSEIRVGYEATTPLRNVAIALGLFTTRGEGVLHVSNETSGQSFGEIPNRGFLVCRFDTASLLPGLYSMNIFATVGGLIADWIVDAATIEVSEGDFYGSGRLPPPGYGHVLVQYAWSLEV
jgi:lipopolysaccharide transport system ATP-binding protein